MADTKNLERAITDLYEVIRSQHQAISFVVATEQALVGTLSNLSELPGFVDRFQSAHEYALAHSTGLGESLAGVQRILDEVGERLKRDIGGWRN